MCNRIDSTTDLLKRMFLNCRASNPTIIEYSDSKKECKMCNKCKLIEDEANYAIFQFEFDCECLQYKFDFKREPMQGIQLITDITFIGFCD